MKCILCRREFKDYQGKLRTRCGSCNTRIRRYRTKLAAIKYLGGECKKCGWKGDNAVFQFHHINPDEKEFTFGNVGNKSWNFLKKELDKCVLLCANCHALEHSKRKEKIFLKEAHEYKGSLLIYDL